MNMNFDSFPKENKGEGEDKPKPNGDLDGYMEKLMAEADRREKAEEERLAYGNEGFSLN